MTTAGVRAVAGKETSVDDRRGQDPLRPWKQAIALVVVTRALFGATAWGAAWFLAGSEGLLTETFISMWDKWDARIFIVISEHGYTGEGTDPHATAVFPLLPLLIRALAVTGLDRVVAGLLVSAVASVVACAFLFRMAEEEEGRSSGRRAALYLLTFPTAVFLIAPYSEGLFLAGAIPAFYYARRSEWWKVALPAAVAVGARAAGMFLLLGLTVEFLRRRKFDFARVSAAATALALAVLPLAAYATFLRRARGDALYFLTDQELGWGRRFPTNPVDSFLNTWNTWEGAGYPTNWIFAWRMEILAAAVGLFFVAWAAARREWGFTAYMGSFLAVLVMSTWYFSIPRMLLSFFPIPLLLASVTKAGPARHEYVILALVPLATLGVIVFTRGGWFY